MERGERNSLARPIRATFRRLPASDLTLSTKVACQADSLPPLPGLLGLLVVRAAGNPLGDRFPFSRSRGFNFHWGITVLGAGSANDTRCGRFAALGRGRVR